MNQTTEELRELVAAQTRTIGELSLRVADIGIEKSHIHSHLEERTLECSHFRCTIEEMQIRMGRLIAEKADAEARCVELAQSHVAQVAAEVAAPAAPVVMVDTPEFRMLAEDWACKYHSIYASSRMVAPDAYAKMVAHTAAAIAQARAAALAELHPAYEAMQLRAIDAEEKLAQASAPVVAMADLAELTIYNFAHVGQHRTKEFFDADDIRKLLSAPQQHAQAPDCHHDDTVRQGAIWEVCLQCGKRFADDVNPRSAEAAQQMLVEHAQAAQYSGEVVELAAALEQEWLAKTIAELRAIEFRDGAFKAGYETALDEIEARCMHDDPAPLEVADSCVTGNAQAALLDERVAFEQEECKNSSNLTRQEDGQYENPCTQSAWEGWQARAILASQQPVAAPAADLTRLTRFHHPYVVDGKPTVRNAVWLDDVVAMLDAEGFSAPVAAAIQAEPLSQPAAEPVTVPFGNTDSAYRKGYQQGRASGLEEAAAVVHDFALSQMDPDRLEAAQACYAAIRALTKGG